MVLINRKPSPAAALKAACYGVVILSLGALAGWAYLQHRAASKKIPALPAAGDDLPAAAGPDHRAFSAYEQELFAPAAFPWSWPALSRLPRAEIRDIRPASPSSPPIPPEAVLALTEALERQAPALARPFTLRASPPYLTTPVTLEVEFDLDADGYVEAAGIAGANAELTTAMAETALTFVFPRDAGAASFLATVTLTPYHCERLKATRGGRPLDDQAYRRLIRALQFGSYPLYRAIHAEAPELLIASTPTRVSFVIGGDGKPVKAAFNPPLPANGAERVAATFTNQQFPRALGGTNVEYVLGPPL